MTRAPTWQPERQASGLADLLPAPAPRTPLELHRLAGASAVRP